MSNWHGGKGSKQRPTDTKKYQDNWDAIFGKKDLPSAGGNAQTPKTSRTKILEALAKAVSICEKDETPDYDAASIKKAINAVIKSL